MMRRPRIAFVGIGQSPRDDVMPSMLAEIGQPIDADDIGLLDGLSDVELAELAPVGDEYPFVARLRGGNHGIFSRAQIEVRLEQRLHALDKQGYDAIVVMCTGTRIPRLQQTPMFEAQRIVDAGAAALAANFNRLGVVVPLEKQARELHLAYEVNVPVETAHASPYTRDRFAQAGKALAQCDLVILHCMGYTAEMQAEVSRHAPGIVLRANQLVASALRCVINAIQSTQDRGSS